MNSSRYFRSLIVGVCLALGCLAPANAQATTQTPLSVGQLVEVTFSRDSFFAWLYKVRTITRSSDGANLGGAIPAGKILMLREVTMDIHTFAHPYEEFMGIQLTRAQVLANGSMSTYGTYKTTLLRLPAGSVDLHNPVTFDFPLGYACPPSFPPVLVFSGYTGTMDTGGGTYVHGWGYLVDAPVLLKAPVASALLPEE